MTTERRLSWRWLLLPPILLTGWVALLAVVMAATDDAPAALVLLPSRNLLASLPEGAGIVSETPFTVTVASSATGLTSALYKAGAWLVLPAGLRGCAPV